VAVLVATGGNNPAIAAKALTDTIPIGPAMQHYQQAILLNRRHRSAHEHLGELYLVLGDLAKAQQQPVRPQPSNRPSRRPASVPIRRCRNLT
jgi:hypothetical protein